MLSRSCRSGRALPEARHCRGCRDGWAQRLIASSFDLKSLEPYSSHRSSGYWCRGWSHDSRRCCAHYRCPDLNSEELISRTICGVISTYYNCFSRAEEQTDSSAIWVLRPRIWEWVRLRLQERWEDDHLWTAVDKRWLTCRRTDQYRNVMTREEPRAAVVVVAAYDWRQWGLGLALVVPWYVRQGNI